MKKIIVTGGTGFLGKRVAERLKTLDYQVVALGRNDQIGTELTAKGILYKHVDLLDRDGLDACFKDVDIVIHCAAKSSLWGKYQDFYNSNVVGTKNIIFAAQKNRVERLIHISSPTIYYDNMDFDNFSQFDRKPQKFINNYAQTKWLAQDEIDKAFLLGLKTITLIPRGIFGPGDTSIFPRLLKINNRLGVPLINNGSHLVELTYIDNVVDAIILCIDSRPISFGKKYIITNNERFAFKELLEMVFKAAQVQPNFKPKNIFVIKALASIIEFFYKSLRIEKEPPLTKYSVEILYRNQTFDMTRTIDELGYLPKISIEDGMQKFGEWWRKNG